MTAFVVVNPRSARGRTGRAWPHIRAGLQSAFPLMEAALSRERGQTAHLVREALKGGHLDIIVVGGDGTLNEAVNGFFEHGRPVSPDAVLGFVASGLWSDFARHFGITPDYGTAIARLRQSHIRRVDVGRLSCLSLQGAPVTRYFINSASFGFSARVQGAINRSRLAGLFGKSAFAAFAALKLPGWHAPRLRLIAEGGYDEIAGITLVAVANGRWFGAGMKVAPEAEASDGKFDIVVVGGAPRLKVFKALAALGRGMPLSNSAMRAVRSTRLTAAPTLETEGRIEIETDGESAGMLPATFEILPAALNLRW